MSCGLPYLSAKRYPYVALRKPTPGSEVKWTTRRRSMRCERTNERTWHYVDDEQTAHRTPFRPNCLLPRGQTDRQKKRQTAAWLVRREPHIYKFELMSRPRSDSRTERYVRVKRVSRLAPPRRRFRRFSSMGHVDGRSRGGEQGRGENPLTDLERELLK